MNFMRDYNCEDNTIKENMKYAYIVSKLRCIVNWIRLQDDRKALVQLKKLLNDIQIIMNKCIDEKYCEAVELKWNLENMAYIKDITLLGDMLENIAIPIIERWLQSRVCVEKEVDDRYRIESTSSGFLTIKDTKANRYIHSNNDPMEEARYLVEAQYDYEKKEYMVWGCGLGYHVYQLYAVSNGSIPIKVYDINPNMLKYAYEYGVLSWIPQDLIEFKLVESTQEFVNNEKEIDGLLFLSSYMNCISDSHQSYPLATRFLQKSFQYSWGHEVRINFNSNRKRNIPDIHELDKSKVKNEVVVIGGGPSVDSYIDIIRQWKGEKTLIAVGTVWKRLIREGIVPDYVVFFDPSDLVFRQIEGIENHSSVLLLAMQANWRIARYYKGPMYTMCHMCPGSGIERYAEDKGYDIWFSGGSVSVLAMEFAIRCFVDRIYMVGLDLSYPGAISHAEGTVARKKMDISNMIPVPAVNGGIVYTDISLDTYRMWIEYIINETIGIEYINMSKEGAKIKGTSWYESIKG